MAAGDDHTVRNTTEASSGTSNGLIDSVQAIDKLPVLNVLVNSLVPGAFLRQAGTDIAHVHILADIAGSVRLPPILVQKRGYRIIDGMHRFEAAKLCRQEYIRAHVVDCADEEALILAVKSNILHGLPLSKADRIAGAQKIMSANPDWSDRALAEVTGLSARTIGLLRNRSADDISEIGKRRGRDGKRRPLSAAEGRRRAADYINAHPDAPLRQVASAADVSLGTVHDVRERLLRGASPVADGRETRLAEAADQQTMGDPSGRLPSASGGDTHAVRAGLHARTRDRNASNTQPTWPSISAKLRNDPTLRYAEDGRAFFRWMTAHATHSEEWREFIDAIPVHWLGDVAVIASNVSKEWHQFAEGLKTKQRSGS